MSEMPVFIEIFALALTIPLAFVLFFGAAMCIRDYVSDTFGERDYLSIVFGIMLMVLGMAISMLPIVVIADLLGVPLI